MRAFGRGYVTGILAGVATFAGALLGAWAAYTASLARERLKLWREAA